MNEFICVLKPTRLKMLTEGPTEEESGLTCAHFQYWNEKYEHNLVKLAGRTQNNDRNTFGIIIFRSSDINKAMIIVKNDLVVLNKIMTAEVFPFSSAIG